MKAIIEKLLTIKQRSYLVINDNFNIIETSFGVNKFSDYPEQVQLDRDIRLGFPELIGSEEVLLEVLVGKRQGFELEGIIKSAPGGKNYYIDIYVVAGQAQTQQKLQSEQIEANNLFIIFEDVTENMIFRQQLIQRENEAYLLVNQLSNAKDYINKVVNSMADALIVTTAEGLIKNINPAAEKLFGYTEAELSKQSITKIAGVDIWLRLTQPNSSTQKLSNLEANCATKSGKEIPIAFSCSTIQLNQEEAGFIFVGRDITVRKRYETAINQLNNQLAQRVDERTRELKQSNEQLQAVLDAVPGFVSWIGIQNQEGLLNSNTASEITASNLNYLGVNHHLATTLNLSTDDFIGQPLGFLEPNSQYAHFMSEFMGSTQQADSQIVDMTLQDSPRNYLVVAQKYQRGTNAVSVGIDITERKQAEEALRKSEQKFRAIFDQTFQFTGLLEPDGKVIEANQTALDFAGVPPAEVVNKPLWDACWWVISSQTKKQLQKAVSLAAKGRFVRYEIELMGGNNQVATIDFSLKPVKDETGKVILLIPEGRDITERKLAEQKIQLQNRRSQLLSEVSLKIRQSLDIEEILQTTVTEVQQLLQADRVLIIRQPDSEQGMVIKEAVLSGFPIMQGQQVSGHCFELDQMDAYRQGRVSVIDDLEAISISFDCQERLRECGVKARLMVPILIKEETWGLLVAHQCSSTRQWTSFEIELLQQLADQIGIALSQAQFLNHLEEMVAERTAKLTAANQQLQQEISDRQQAEEQLRLIADNLPVLIAYIDAQQCYRFNNQAYAEWFGKSPEQAQGYHMREVIGETLYQRYQEQIIAVLSGSRVTFEGEINCIDGSIRNFNAVYIPHFNENSQVQGFFSVVIDISDRIAVERMKDEFLSIASHELRTPLTSIRGSLGLLATGQLGELAPKGQRLLDIAVNNTDRLSRLINDILDLERMKSGKVRMAKQACDALQLMEQAAELMQAMADKAQVMIENNLPTINASSTSLWADPDHILQTLTNLLSNAIKFSPPAGVVSLSLEVRSQDILFQVQDQGRGIPTDKLEKIFERFQQVDASDSRQKGGTGLGLAICRQIVNMHGGQIWVESTLGEGSTFLFTLPKPSNK